MKSNSDNLLCNNFCQCDYDDRLKKPRTKDCIFACPSKARQIIKGARFENKKKNKLK